MALDQTNLDTGHSQTLAKNEMSRKARVERIVCVRVSTISGLCFCCS